jgi:hypothetical protein
MIGPTADAGDNFKNRAAIPLAPCTYSYSHREEMRGSVEGIGETGENTDQKLGRKYQHY